MSLLLISSRVIYSSNLVRWFQFVSRRYCKICKTFSTFKNNYKICQTFSSFKNNKKKQTFSSLKNNKKKQTFSTFSTFTFLYFCMFQSIQSDCQFYSFCQLSCFHFSSKAIKFSRQIILNNNSKSNANCFLSHLSKVLNCCKLFLCVFISWRAFSQTSEWQKQFNNWNIKTNPFYFKSHWVHCWFSNEKWKT